MPIIDTFVTDNAGNRQLEQLEPMGQGQYVPGVATYRPAIFESEFMIASGMTYSLGMVVGPDKILGFTLPDFYVGMTGQIVKAVIETDNKFFSGSFRLHLFRQPVGTVQKTSQWFNQQYVDRKGWEGDIDFPAMIPYTTGGNAATTMALLAANDIPFPFYCGVTGSLYGVLEARSAFAAQTGQNFYVGLETDLE